MQTILMMLLLLEKLQKERTAVHLGVKMLQHQLLQEKGKVKMLEDQANYSYSEIMYFAEHFDFIYLNIGLKKHFSSSQALICELKLYKTKGCCKKSRIL